MGDGHGEGNDGEGDGVSVTLLVSAPCREEPGHAKEIPKPSPCGSPEMGVVAKPPKGRFQEAGLH